MMKANKDAQDFNTIAKSGRSKFIIHTRNES